MPGLPVAPSLRGESVALPLASPASRPGNDTGSAGTLWSAAVSVARWLTSSSGVAEASPPLFGGGALQVAAPPSSWPHPAALGGSGGYFCNPSATLPSPATTGSLGASAPPGAGAPAGAGVQLASGRGGPGRQHLEFTPPRRQQATDVAMEAPVPLSPLGTPFTPPRRNTERQKKEAADGNSSEADVGETTAANVPTEPHQQALQDDEVAPGNASAATPSPQRFWYLNLDAIYTRMAPEKRHKIPELLEKNRGQEALLYKRVCDTYGLPRNRYYANAVAWNDLPGTTASGRGGWRHRAGALLYKAASKFTKRWRRQPALPPKSRNNASSGSRGDDQQAIAQPLATKEAATSAERRTTLLLGKPSQDFRPLLPGPGGSATLFGVDTAGNNSGSLVEASREASDPDSDLWMAAATQVVQAQELEMSSPGVALQAAAGAAAGLGSAANAPETAATAAPAAAVPGDSDTAPRGPPFWDLLGSSQEAPPAKPAADKSACQPEQPMRAPVWQPGTWAARENQEPQPRREATPEMLDRRRILSAPGGQSQEAAAAEMQEEHDGSSQPEKGWQRLARALPLVGQQDLRTMAAASEAPRHMPFGTAPHEATPDAAQTSPLSSAPFGVRLRSTSARGCGPDAVASATGNPTPLAAAAATRDELTLQHHQLQLRQQQLRQQQQQQHPAVAPTGLPAPFNAPAEANSQSAHITPRRPLGQNVQRLQSRLLASGDQEAIQMPAAHASPASAPFGVQLRPARGRPDAFAAAPTGGATPVANTISEATRGTSNEPTLRQHQLQRRQQQQQQHAAIATASTGLPAPFNAPAEGNSQAAHITPRRPLGQNVQRLQYQLLTSADQAERLKRKASELAYSHEEDPAAKLVRVASPVRSGYVRQQGRALPGLIRPRPPTE